MDETEIEDLMRKPLRFDIPLSFPDEDKLAYPWLDQRDRYYKIEKQLGKGGFSLAFDGFPCDVAGNRCPDSASVVIKVPNLSGGHLSKETEKRTNYIQKQSIAEWEHVRRRLIRCKYANPIFDMGILWVEIPPKTPLYVTAQPLLLSAIPLREWLANQRLRGEVVYDQVGEEQNWHGIDRFENWLSVATMIGEGLAQIHKHRVVHGDIWPSNIYVRDSDPPLAPAYPIFIDFGESFLVMPSGEPRTQKENPYRAPEREKAASVNTEQVDVYSFGKLMLYLAVGICNVIPRLEGNRLIFGHKRREWVRNELFMGNPKLVKAHPEIVDFISQCVEADPAGRPTMVEICDQLHDFSSGQVPLPPRLEDIANRVQKIASQARENPLEGVFLCLADRKLRDVERLIESCDTDMIEINGTRDVLIAALVNLFGELRAGDSWTTLTTPTVWQHGALGLDGRYLTATIHALKRRASIHRAYAVSVEELGVAWTERLVRSLNSSGHTTLTELGGRFEKAIIDWNYWTYHEKSKPKSPDYMRQHQQRFTLLIESLQTAVSKWDIVNHINADKFSDIRATQGLFLGLAPTGTESQIRVLRSQNPVSLMYQSHKAEEKDKWLLVMTDIRGKSQNEPINNTASNSDLGASKSPELRRIRVYKSVMGVPTDRILSLKSLLGDNSSNVGPVLAKLHECVCGLA